MTSRSASGPLTVFMSAFIGLALSGEAAAQPAVDRIAYDQCGPDLDTWMVRCDVHIMADGTETLLMMGGVGPRWSPDGSRVAFTGDGADILVVTLADGSVANLTNHPARDWGARWSRDGRIAFVSDRDGPLEIVEIYVMDMDGANPTRLTHNVGFNGAFDWSPDGGRIAFASDRDGAPELYVMNADGSSVTRLTYGVGFMGTFAWSRDGGRIAFDTLATGISAINADGTNFVPLTPDSPGDHGAVFSPVGDRLAMLTSRFGAANIAVMDGDATVTPVGAAGSQLVWSPDGGRLAFVGTTASLLGRCYPEGGAHNADDFCLAVSDIYVVNVDGTGLRAIAVGSNIDWFTPLPGSPVAAFTSQCNTTTCDFDASGSQDADGAIVSYLWQFGDGTSASGATASHTYSTGARYTVTLTVTDNAGATATRSVSVEANAPPVASYTVVCNGPTCTFDGSGASDSDGTIASYSWLFGDGQSGGGASTYPKATHTYATGTFSATLVVSDNGGSTGTHMQSVTIVNALPVVSFTQTCAGLTCTFDGSASSDSDGYLQHVLWRFGDGGSRYGVLGITHTYTAAGSYIVSLEVLDNAFQSVTHSETVTLGNAPPVASFTRTCSGLTCTFNGSASSDADGTIASYAWSFGDGTTGSGAAANRTYAASGTYTVTLIVTDNGGATSTHSQTVAVVPPQIHVGDLDRARTMQPTRWTAIVTITVHDSNHDLVGNAAVTGSWNNGSTGSCTTNASGQCAVSSPGILKNKTSVSFTVTNVARAAFVYTPAANHDPDGDSSGTTVTVTRP
jgi:PKD repeat protein